MISAEIGDSGPKAVDSDLAPPIELCIRTRQVVCFNNLKMLFHAMMFD